MRTRIITTALLFSSILTVSAQDAWTLPKCIEYAIEHNLNIKQQEANKMTSEIELNTSKWSRLPDLNGNVSQSFTYGRSLQMDNTYADRNTRSSYFSLSTNVPIFTGFQIPNTIALNKLNLSAAIEDLNKAKEDISVQVASAFTQILYNQELAKVARNQVALSQEQLKMKQAYFENGKASEAEVYEAKARVAQDEMSAVQAENNYKISLLDLSQMLELSSPENFNIKVPEIKDDFREISMPDAIYNEIVMNKPVIKAAQYRVDGADRSIKIAKSSYYPQLSFSAGINTNYYATNGMENKSFSTQFDKNVSKSFSFNLSVPIFNRFSVRNRVRTAKVQKMASEWRLDQAKKDLYKEIQQAYYQAVAAESKYKSSNIALDAAEVSFKLMNEKYINGKANATQYNEARTNMLKALSDKIQAKYEYLFRTKVLDFYKGVPLNI